MPSSRQAELAFPGPSLPPSTTVRVRAEDGTRLHTEVFGPEDGYPIVLAHGITCSLRVWHEQINDLSRDFRVIAYDHRGHGRSGVPARRAYSLQHLAGDLDAVLAATLRRGARRHRRALDGRYRDPSWADRFRHRVEERADAGRADQHHHRRPAAEDQAAAGARHAAGGRALAAKRMIRTFGGHRFPRCAARQPSFRRDDGRRRRGRSRDRRFRARPVRRHPARRPWRVNVLVNEMGPRHIDLSGLTVPTLVIGGTRTGCYRCARARKIADAAPNLVELVEMPAGTARRWNIPRPSTTTCALVSAVLSTAHQLLMVLSWGPPSPDEYFWWTDGPRRARRIPGPPPTRGLADRKIAMNANTTTTAGRHHLVAAALVGSAVLSGGAITHGSICIVHRRELARGRSNRWDAGSIRRRASMSAAGCHLGGPPAARSAPPRP